MRLLLDTHTLLWSSKGGLPKDALAMVEDTANSIYFSSVNLWELELKKAKLNIDVADLYQKLLYRGYIELQITTQHVLGLEKLPKIHTNPSDRILISQAQRERIYLLTADKTIKQYRKFLDCIIGFDV